MKSKIIIQENTHTHTHTRYICVIGWYELWWNDQLWRGLGPEGTNLFSTPYLGSISLAAPCDLGGESTWGSLRYWKQKTGGGVLVLEIVVEILGKEVQERWRMWYLRWIPRWGSGLWSEKCDETTEVRRRRVKMSRVWQGETLLVFIV